MTAQLSQRMIEDMQLWGLAERTQEMYVIVMRQLAEHYGKPPNVVTKVMLLGSLQKIGAAPGDAGSSNLHLQSLCSQVLVTQQLRFASPVRRPRQGHLQIDQQKKLASIGVVPGKDGAAHAVGGDGRRAAASEDGVVGADHSWRVSRPV